MADKRRAAAIHHASPYQPLTNEAAVLDLGVDVDLVFLPHLKPEVSDENVHQHGSQVVYTRSQSGYQPRVEWNQVHPVEGRYLLHTLHAHAT